MQCSVIQYIRMQSKKKGVKMNCTIRVSKELIAKIEREAARQTRNRSNMIEYILTEWFRARDAEPEADVGQHEEAQRCTDV